MKGKVAIITASSTGIGKSIAIRLAQQGVKVIISSRNIANINQTVREIQDMGYQAYGIVCHVGKKEDRQKLVSQTLEKYGRIDFLIPNAAVSLRMDNYLDATESQILKMFQINYLSTYSLIKLVLPELKKNKGSIVIISTYGAYEILKISGQYGLTKLMLVGMTRILASILIQEQVRVNCVCPGLIKTDFSKYIWNDEATKTWMMKRIQIKRLGVPEEISGAVRFLLSDEASYINGQSVVIAGRPSSRL